LKEDFIANYRSWADFDFVFANATCFTPEMVEKVQELIATKQVVKKSGDIFVLTTKELQLSEEEFERIGPLKKCMSWGGASVYGYRRR
jgi:hypothetical protein